MTSAADLADELAELRRRVKTLERAPRLANASIEGHPLLVNDGDQQLRQTIGLQADGTYTVVDTNGPPPPVPSPPILEARAGTLVVTWDGTFAGQVAAPADWDHVEVHVFTVPGYVPNDSTEVITFHSLKGGSVTLALNPVAQYVVLQAVNTSRVESAPTAQVAGTPLPAATGAGGVKTYLETDPPIGLVAADDGALWYDTNDGNHPYRWAGGTVLAWVSIRDTTIASAQAAAANALTTAQTAQTTADGKAVAYFQPAEPTGQVPGDVGDLWFDTDDGNKMWRYSGTAWVVAQDQSIATALTNAAAASTAAGVAQSTADSKIVTLYQTAAPSGAGRTVGDLWVDTDDGNHLYRWDGAAWVSVRDTTIATASAAASSAQTQANTALTAAQAAQATADGAIRTYYTATAPTGLNATSDVGDLWFNTTDQSAHRWNGTAWVLIQDTSIATALAAAQNAQTTADGKITAYYQISPPTVGEVGDLWYDTDDKNKPYFCSTASAPGPVVWTAVRDLTIADAQAAANAAQAAANTAQAAATSDGLAPTASPDPIALSLIDLIMVRWTPITNRDPVTYEIHVSTTLGFTPDSTTLAGKSTGSQFSISALPGPDPAPGTPDPRLLKYDTAYYIRIVARDADGPAPASLQAVGSVFRVTGVNLAADSVTAQNIAAHSLTGELFSATVIIAGTFKSSETGQRVEWGAAGIQGYRPDGSLLLNIPTDGSNALFDGELIIRGATVLGGMTMRSSENEVAPDGKLRLAAGVRSPIAAPQLSKVYDSYKLDTSSLTAAQKTGTLGTFDLNPSEVTFAQLRAGFLYVFQVRPGLGTRVWFFTVGTGAPASPYLGDFKDEEYYGEEQHTDSKYYTVVRWIPDGQYYVKVDGNFHPYTRINTSQTPAMGKDAAGLFIAEPDPSNGKLNMRHFTASGAHMTPVTIGNVVSTSTTQWRKIGTIINGSFDLGVNRYLALEFATGNALKAISSSGTVGEVAIIDAARGFESAASATRGLWWDGANFFTLGSDSYVYKHTSTFWDPATTSAVWWASTTLSDTNAAGTGAHETDQGPRRSITMPRRSTLLISVPPLPTASGVDDPNKWNLYLGRGASEPARTGMFFQGATGPALSAIVVTPNFSGISPPATNNFPDANPGRIESTALGVDISPKFYVNGAGDGRWLIEDWHVVGNATTGLGTTFLNSWTDVAGTWPTTRFAKDRMGFVWVWGRINNTVTASQILSPFTMPTGYRPPFTWAVLCRNSNGAATTTAINFGADGVVSIVGAATATIMFAERFPTY